ncbi:MAG TPA: GSCFA domain-containing protein [Candidatus Sulfopaludibacter sp.]|jgi:hypothetical protein|nr:GSCFA domain-containing protein [Candidatus Sulfopaludibacter sp.]
MPLITIPGNQAVSNRKTNRVADWGDRSTGNRVEPVAKPEFYPTFTIEKAAKIFTIGSCFARFIENELLKRGFDLPVRALLSTPLFADMEHGVLDNYGTPSIYNELAWAFDPDRPFVPEDHLLAVRPGKFADLHLPPHLSLADWDVLVARRQAIRQMNLMAADCQVVIITLGLAEVWFDTATGYYLNDTVRPSLIRLHPDRFELHVLSSQETYGYLEKALLLLRQNAHCDQRVLLTVSPVPMRMTHRDIDVMVANTYSKSMLRVVAEEICSKFDWVDYYPSYESVTLSDRQIAWEPDLIHVTSAFVAFNVDRMISRYVSSGEATADLRARIESGGQIVAEDLAAAAVKADANYAKSFFEEFGSWSARSATFALEHANYLFSQRDDEGVLRVLSGAPSDNEPLASTLLKAQAFMRLGRAPEALALLSSLDNQKLRSQQVWELLIQAHAKNNDPEKAIATTQAYLADMGFLKHWAFLNLARAFRDTNIPKAIYYYEIIIDDFVDGDQWIQYEIADFLAQQQRFDGARKMLSTLRPEDSYLMGQVSALKGLLAG